MSSTRPSGWGFSPDSPLSCTDISTDFSFYWGFPDSSVGQESTCNAGNSGDVGSIPGLGRSPGGGHGNPLQYSCLENPHGQRSLAGYSPWVTKSQTRLKLPSMHAHVHIYYIHIYVHICMFLELEKILFTDYMRIRSHFESTNW